MKHYFLPLFIFTLTTLMSCSSQRVTPSNNIVTRNVEVTGSFNAIDISAPVKVVYTQSAKTDIVIESPDNISSLIKTSIKSGTLNISFSENTNINGQCNTTIYVSSPTLNDIDLSSASSVEISQGLVCENGIDIELSSAATMSISSLKCVNADIECSSSAQAEIKGIEATGLNVEASSASTVTLFGKAGSVNFEATSASNIEASELSAETGKAVASSAASINCNVASLNATQSSSGSVSNKQ